MHEGEEKEIVRALEESLNHGSELSIVPPPFDRCKAVRAYEAVFAAACAGRR